jgi:putative transposase
MLVGRTPDTTYLTDVSDAEWAVLRPLLPCPASSRGRPRRHSRRTIRTILKAIFSVLRTGCAWRFLPTDPPAWQTG